MVLLHVKRSDDSLFLYETSTQTPIDQLSKDIATIHNLRLRIERLAQAALDLADYGPMKPDNEHGYSETYLQEAAKSNTTAVEKKMGKNAHGADVLLNPDPIGKRCGEAPLEEMAEIIRKTVAEAREGVSKDLVDRKICLTESACIEFVDKIRGAVTIVYPMGLPDFDPVREILEENEALEGTSHAKEIIDPQSCSLWWAGKEFQNGKNLASYVGKNEKTKIIVKIQKRGQGAPVREPPIDAKGQKDLMAYYYRKQEEQKKLAENEEDDYLHSSWANPRSLKNSFLGMNEVGWRPK